MRVTFDANNRRASMPPPTLIRSAGVSTESRPVQRLIIKVKNDDTYVTLLACPFRPTYAIEATRLRDYFRLKAEHQVTFEAVFDLRSMP